MSAQLNEQFTTFTHQFAAAAARANRLALENAETIFGVQLKTLEKNIDATTAYFTELSEIRDVEAYKTVLPKGLQVAKENAERAAAAGQEVIGLTLKTNEALGQLAKSQFEAASESAQATVAKATKTVKGKKAFTSATSDNVLRTESLPSVHRPDSTLTLSGFLLPAKRQSESAAKPVQPFAGDLIEILWANAAGSGVTQ